MIIKNKEKLNQITIHKTQTGKIAQIVNIQKKDLHMITLKKKMKINIIENMIGVLRRVNIENNQMRWMKKKLPKFTTKNIS